MSRDDKSFTGTHRVVLPKDVFDPDTVFYDELEVKTTLTTTDLDVPGLRDESVFDKVARALDRRVVEWESDDNAATNRNLSIDGFEMSLFRKIMTYFRSLKP